MRTIAKPQPGEYAPYTIDYISRVPDDGMALTHLEAGARAMRQTVAAIPDKWLRAPFADGEWTVQEILVHVMDTERIFGYRALRIGRGDVTDLPGFDQNTYIPYANANERTLESLFKEYDSIRAATLTLFESLDDAAYVRVGTANKNPLSVRAALYIIAGHELHHLESIRQNYANLT